jgi:phosphatidate cytidylyltransferase
MKDSNLLRRLLFAAWAIPAGWWFVNSRLSLLPSSFTRQYFTDPEMILRPAHLAAMLVIFLGALEYTRMLGLLYPRNGFWLTYIWLGLQFASRFFPGISLSAALDTYLLLILVAVEAIIWGKYTGRWKRASLLFSGIVFLSIAGISLLNLYRDPFQQILPPTDTWMFTQPGIILVLAAIFLCDSAAYFVGKYFGKRHFSSISPKKTIEGSIGGLAASVIVSGIGWHYISANAYPWYFGILMGLVIGIFAQMGDLLVSLMKRYYRVKDSSHIIPGHGGILDRFDSVFFTAPMLNLFFIIISKSGG